MISILARGRIAWILAAVFGVVMIAVGIATQQVFLDVVGAAFLLFGLVFLILSFVTHGQTD